MAWPRLCSLVVIICDVTLVPTNVAKERDGKRLRRESRELQKEMKLPDKDSNQGLPRSRLQAEKTSRTESSYVSQLQEKSGCTGRTYMLPLHHPGL